MLNRKVFVQLEQWFKSGIRKAAFLDGARQVCPKATTTARIWRMPCFSNFTGTDFRPTRFRIITAIRSVGGFVGHRM